MRRAATLKPYDTGSNRILASARGRIRTYEAETPGLQPGPVVHLGNTRIIELEPLPSGAIRQNVTTIHAYRGGCRNSRLMKQSWFALVTLDLLSFSPVA